MLVVKKPQAKDSCVYQNNGIVYEMVTQGQVSHLPWLCRMIQIVWGVGISD